MSGTTTAVTYFHSTTQFSQVSDVQHHTTTQWCDFKAIMVCSHVTSLSTTSKFSITSFVMETQNIRPEAIIYAKVNIIADNLTFNIWRIHYVWTTLEVNTVVTPVSFARCTFTVVVVSTKCCAHRPMNGWLPLSEEFLHLTRSHHWNTQQ